MGSTAWSNDTYTALKTDHQTKSTAQIFTSTSTDNELSPKGIKFRECRDSDVHPASVAIAVFLDVTGSMGVIPEKMVREKLGPLMTTLIDHGVPDAQVMFAAIGDHYTDTAPLQVSQFEAGTDELNKWLTKIYLEGHGGGQEMESYSLAWLFAARHTSIDCFEKRAEKGFLFTIGDECMHSKLERDKLKELLGYPFEADLDSEQLLAEAQRTYHVFHLHCTETSTGRNTSIQDWWKKLLGEKAIMVDHYEHIAEIIASTVAIMNGANLDKVIAGFDSHTAKGVTNALMKVSLGVSPINKKEGIVKL
jgi:hypothetical protein